MKTRTKLIPGQIKSVGLPASLHAQLKAEAKANHAAIFEVIMDAIEARDRLAQLEAQQDNGHEPSA